MNNLKATFQIISEESVKRIQEGLSSLELKEEKTERKFKVVASTEDIDRSGEIIKVNGWKRENFMKNPVIIANHVYKIENIVGKATSIYVKDNQLIIEGVFAESNPLGKLLSDLYEEGMVKTVSVGFIPNKRDEKNPKIISEAELLELSFVAVPCNPNALSLDQKQLLEENGMIDEVEEENEEPENEEENSPTEENKILSTLNDIKTLLEILVDGNTKKLSEANILAKETLQNVARTVNQGLSEFKKSL